VEARVDRTAFSVSSLSAPANDLAYWLAQPPEARLAAMALMRWINFGDAANARIEKFFEVVSLKDQR
jgi:hypothetical protein